MRLVQSNFIMLRLLSIACLASVAAGFTPQVTSKARVTAPTFRHETTPVKDYRSQCSTTELNALLQSVDVPDKYYPPQEKEIPKVLGGVKIGLRKLVVVTGASSGLGLQCAKTLAKSGRYFVVMAVRDVEKGKKGKCLPVNGGKFVEFIGALYIFFLAPQLRRKAVSLTTLTL